MYIQPDATGLSQFGVDESHTRAFQKAPSPEPTGSRGLTSFFVQILHMYELSHTFEVSR